MRALGENDRSERTLIGESILAISNPYHYLSFIADVFLMNWNIAFIIFILEGWRHISLGHPGEVVFFTFVRRQLSIVELGVYAIKP